MAEAEDVIVDAAKHVTAFLQEHWRRRSPQRPQRAALADHVQRLELLLAAAFGRALKIRPAQPPAPRTILRRIFETHPSPEKTIPATDGEDIWLPEMLDTTDPEEALARYRVMALRQGMRAVRGSASVPFWQESPLVQDAYLLLEAASADVDLMGMLPGIRVAVIGETTSSPLDSLARARSMAPTARVPKDEWTGELRQPASRAEKLIVEEELQPMPPSSRTAMLRRTPKLREPLESEEEQKPGHFMVQTSQPSEHAEDPMGMQRPTDRDDATAAEDLAESVADLPEARLVTRPGSPKEILLSPEISPSSAKAETTLRPSGIAYPEWDYRIGGYRTPGAIVRTPEPLLGDPAWAARTLEHHAAVLRTIRRRFEMLRARRVRLRRQVDGEEIDLDACVESAADWHAGLPRAERLYQTLRPARREMALVLLIDVSGSTDSWVSGNRRVIDVEREALLLVCIALEAMCERYAVHAFSGEGPDAVIVRSVKSFDEHHSETVSRRIAALEPERYTRVGAALRHVSAMLMREPARHRLLLLLSDGKPNDIDRYEGRYGVEDMRHAVLEAKLQGIAPFCLTVDRSAAAYLPGVFGMAQYALLPRPELLPGALLEWIRHLASS